MSYSKTSTAKITGMKIISAFLAISLLFFQIPLIQAAQPVDNATGVSIPTVLIDESAPARVADGAVTNVQNNTDTTFLENSVTIMPPEKSKTPVIALRIPGLVRNDLMNTFGFGEEQLKELLRKGLIKIQISVTEKGDRSAVVTIDPSVKLPANAVNLTDPLGSNKLPRQINYQFKRALLPCGGEKVCPAYGAGFELVSASFKNDKGQAVQVIYEHNQIKKVMVFQPTTIICFRGLCPSVKLVKEINYSNFVINNVRDNNVFLKDRLRKFQARIIYHDGSQGDVVSRLVEFDTKGQIKTVTEYGKDGKMIAKNVFAHVPLCVRAICVSGPLFIVRTDASGKPLSIINFKNLANGKIRFIITLPSGEKTYVQMGELIIEEILNLARKIEKANPRIVPFNVSVFTEPGIEPNLSVVVDKDGNATVTWNHDDTGLGHRPETRTGKFDPVTKTIVLEDSGKHKWTLNFKNDNGRYSLNSFQTEGKLAGTSTSQLYRYVFTDGILETAVYQWEYPGAHGESIAHYVVINDKLLVESNISNSQYADGTNFQVKTYFGYDEQGIEIARIEIKKLKLKEGEPWVEGYYSIKDFAGLQAVSANMYSKDNLNAFDLINSWKDAGVIDQFAHTRSARFFSDGNLTKLKHTIEYAKDESDVFIPRKTVLADKSTYIVQGEPDVISGENDDIRFKDWQFITETNKWRVYYGAAYADSRAQDNGKFMGYGLVFIDQAPPSLLIEYGKPPVVVLVDFPNETTVELDGKKYEIEIDSQGIVVLKEELHVEPFTILISSNPSGGDLLSFSIQVDENGNAKVTLWPNTPFSKTSEGKFDSLDEILLVELPAFGFHKAGVWKLTFEESSEDVTEPYYLKRFETMDRQSIYELNSDGRIVHSLNASETADHQYKSVGESFYSYVTIDGKFFVESAISKSSHFRDGELNNEIIRKDFYAYDETGNRIKKINLQSTWLSSREPQSMVTAHYRIWDDSNKTATHALVQGQDYLMNDVKNVEDYKLIEQLATAKSVYHYDVPSAFGQPFRIEYIRMGNEFAPKLVHFKEGGLSEIDPGFTPGRSWFYIVKGEPDILSGETDDILIADDEVDGHSVRYGGLFNSRYPYNLLEYGLVFDERVVVDYPNETTVELDGKKYEIKIDENGTITLMELFDFPIFCGEGECKIEPGPDFELQGPIVSTS